MSSVRDPYSEYLSANGGPRSDTFMGRVCATDADAGRCVARAVVRARAALDASAALDGDFDGQPLLRTLAWEAGWLRRRPASLRAAFVTPVGVFVSDVADEVALCVALGAAIAGRPSPLRPLDLQSTLPTDAVVAVAVAPQPTGDRHVHRRAWTRGGGPGLGVGDAPPYEIVTTCHLLVDGYGHARLATAVFGAEDRRRDFDVLARAAGLDQSLPAEAAGPLADAWTVAARELPGRPPPFTVAAYAFGVVIREVYGRFATFQVPVAPGNPADTTRRRSRVVHGLLRPRAGDTRAEFAARLPAWLARARAGQGVLSLLTRAAASAPLPLSLRRRLLTGGRGTPIATALAGRGCLSVLRFVGGEIPDAPLVAASMPGLDAAQGGGVVLTLIEHAGGTTATMTHTGPLGTAEGMLEGWISRI